MRRETTKPSQGRRLRVGPGVRAFTIVSLLVVAAGAMGDTRAQIAPQPKQVRLALTDPRWFETAEPSHMAGQGRGAEAGSLVRLAQFRSVLATFWVRWAVNDAARRLQEPDCRRIFSDFTDQSGNLLSANLSRLGMTPLEFVARGLLFVDASDRLPCLSDSRGAFTSPGSRVIFVCASRLVPVNSEPSQKIGLVIIHETLHALGLGENPPSSAQISRQVARRCDS